MKHAILLIFWAKHAVNEKSRQQIRSICRAWVNTFKILNDLFPNVNLVWQANCSKIQNSFVFNSITILGSIKCIIFSFNSESMLIQLNHSFNSNQCLPNILVSLHWLEWVISIESTLNWICIELNQHWIKWDIELNMHWIEWKYALNWP